MQNLRKQITKRLALAASYERAIRRPQVGPVNVNALKGATTEYRAITQVHHDGVISAVASVRTCTRTGKPLTGVINGKKVRIAKRIVCH